MSWDLSQTPAPSSSCAASERQYGGDLLADVVQQVMETGCLVRFVVRGGSMYPCIRDGDTVEVIPVTPEQVRPGQILFCRRHDGRPVAHRVVDVIRGAGDTRVFLRGDTTSGGGESIPVTSIIGQVIAVKRQGKRCELTGFRGWLWSRRGFRLLVQGWLRARRCPVWLMEMAMSRLRP